MEDRAVTWPLVGGRLGKVEGKTEAFQDRGQEGALEGEGHIDLGNENMHTICKLA